LAPVLVTLLGRLKGQRLGMRLVPLTVTQLVMQLAPVLVTLKGPLKGQRLGMRLVSLWATQLE
jgi:hypothetical protein